MSKEDKARLEHLKKLFPYAKMEDFKDIVWPDHIKGFIEQIRKEYFTNNNVEMPAYFLKYCKDGIGLSISDFNDKVVPNARAAAHMAVLHEWKPAATPMSEETKQYLRELNASKRKDDGPAGYTNDDVVTEPIENRPYPPRVVESWDELLSKRDISDMPSVNPEYWANAETEASKPEVVGAVKRVKSAEVTTSVNKKAPGRKPIYEDLARQKELLSKYPWAVAGSFKKDPEKEASTILDILCTKCNKNKRTIHAPDLFQVKLCLECKIKK